MSKVCDGLRGDAFAAAQEVGLDNLCEIVDGTPHGIDTLIRHMREMVFPLTEHESKELFLQYCRTGGPLSRQKGESLIVRIVQWQEHTRLFQGVKRIYLRPSDPSPFVQLWRHGFLGSFWRRRKFPRMGIPHSIPFRWQDWR